MPGTSSEPTPSTVKRLFAKSGNRCAFPKCKQPKLVVGSTVVAKIAHIKGERPTSARYDKDQTAEDRRSFENLILLCGTHHDIVDDDEIAYTVQRLALMKNAHEAAATEITDEEEIDRAASLILNMGVSVQAQNIQNSIAASVYNQYVTNNYPDIPTSVREAEPRTATQERASSNLTFVGSILAGVSEASSELWSRHVGRFERVWSTSNQQLALLARFSNEALPNGRNVGCLVKAQLIFQSVAGEFLRIGGCWLDEQTDFVEFRVDETHELIILIQLGERMHALSKRRKGVAFNSESIVTTAERLPNVTEGRVKVRLTNADTGDFLYERVFRFGTEPLELTDLPPDA